MRNRAKTFDEPLRDDFAHAGELNTRAFAGLDGWSGRLPCADFRFCRGPHVGFGDAPFRTSSLYAGKIDTEFGRDSARDRRRLYARFFGLWWQPCRLRWCRRHACLYSFLFLFLLRLTFLLGLLFWLFFFRLNFVGLLFFLLLFDFRLFLFPFFFFLGRFLALSTDERDLVADVYLAAFFDINLGKRSIFGRLPFHRRLVGLDLGEHFAGRNVVALLLFPRDDGALGHGVAEFGHLNLRHGGKESEQ